MKELTDYKKRILITGGCGFIGSHVVRHFVKNYPDYLIVNFDALTYAGNPENLKDIENEDNYVFVKGDIRFKTSLIKQVSDKLIGGSKDCPIGVKQAFDKYQITDVIHLAAESHVDRSMTNPTVFADTNVMGTLNLLNEARECWKEDYSKHKFFNMGTDEIFGALSVDDEPFNENTPLDPHSPYSTSKTAQVMFAKTYYEAYGVPTISLACGNAIGPNQFPEKLVPLVIDRIINKQEIPVYGEGKQMRDWTNVFDICDAIDLLFHKGTVGELYCIGGDACKQNVEIIEEIMTSYADYVTDYETGDGSVAWGNSYYTLKELRHLIKFIPDPRGKSHDFRYDINHDKITKELGWKPKYTFGQSVKETVKWYLENQEWVEHCKSGEYQNWIKEYYKNI